ncbi:fucose permease [Arthrobacter sp. B3I4]|nr:fucose permease [Arthrobacter sp. B3I4]
MEVCWLVSLPRAGTARLLSALTGTVAFVGAAGPLFIVSGLVGASPAPLLASIALIHVATVLFHRLVPKAGKTEPENLAAETRTGSPAKSLLVLLAPVAAALFVYVGIETVFSGWSAVIATDVLALDPHTAAAGTSVFWVLMAAGRYAAWCILKSSVTPSALLTVACTLAVACFAAAGLVRQVNPGLAMVFSGVAILSLGPTYSLVLGIGLSRVKIYDAKKAVGLLVAIGAAGGAGIPAVLLSVTLRPGASRILVTAAFLTALIAPLTVHKKSPPEPSAEKNAD